MTFADPVPECWAHFDIPSLLGSAGLKGQYALICQLQTSLEVCSQMSPKTPTSFSTPLRLPMTWIPFAQSNKKTTQKQRCHPVTLSQLQWKVSYRTVIHSLHSMTFLSVPTHGVTKLHWHRLIQPLSPSLFGTILLPLISCLPGNFNIKVPVEPLMIPFGICWSI